jgi:hypothetical protein
MRSLRISSFFALLAAASMLWSQSPGPQSLGPAQTASEATAKPAMPVAADVHADLQAVIKKQFGGGFTVAMSPGTIVTTHITHEDDSPWTPLLTGDLDGDGVEDAVILAKGKDPLGGASQFDYKVQDPMNSFFGWGNPKVTSTFSTADPVHNFMVLVIHGSGKEGWRAEKPKAKFVIINLNFDRVTLSGASLKKKPVAAMRVEESDGVSSLVFWDGKKYKYAPGAGGGG